MIDLGELSPLATALGLVDAEGEFQGDWLSDPGARLRTVMADEVQRDALIEFVDEVLGGDERQTDSDGRIWLPIVSQDDPDVELCVVVDDRPPDHVALGLGVRLATASPQSLSTLHVPLFRAAKLGETVEPLLLGSGDGRLQLVLEVTVEAGPPVPGEAHLGAIALSFDVPTGPGGGDPAFGLALRGLQLPGAAAPRDLEVSAAGADDLDDAVLELVLGLVQAQAEAGGPQIAAIAGLLGLMPGSGVPALAIDALVRDGREALAAWFRDVVADDAARAAWLAQLAQALEGAVAGDEVTLTVGAAAISLGVAVTTDGAGQPVVTPRLALSVDAAGDVRARVEVEPVRLDLGPGTATALPSLSAFVQLGRRTDGTGTPLITGDPRVDGLRAGLALDASRRATILLAADGVVIAGHEYPTLDLTDGDALAETATTLLTDVIADLLGGLGPAGALIAELVGLAPPAGHPAVPTVELAGFLADPLDAVCGHWRVLTADHADAVPAVLGRLRELLVGAAPVSGAGSAADPWALTLAGPVALEAWREGDVLSVALAATYVVDTLGQRCTRVTTRLAAHLAQIDLAGCSASLLPAVDVSLTARARGSTEALIDLGPLSIVADHVGLLGRWRAAGGLTLGLDAPGLRLRTDEGEAPIALPTRGPDGGLVLDEAGWAALEGMLGLLALHGRADLEGAGDPVAWLVQLVDALGWTTVDPGVPRLSLEDLVSDLPAALSSWLRDAVAATNPMALDRGPLGVLVEALGRALAGSPSAFAHVTGAGRPDDPYLLHLDALPGRPALAAWALPGGPPAPGTLVPDELRGWQPGSPPVGVDVLADALAADSGLDPALAGLVAGRADVRAGLLALAERWAGGDGAIVPPSTVPAGTVVHRVADRAAGELRGVLDLVALLGLPPDTVVNVAVIGGDVAAPWPDAPPARVIDLRAPGLAPEAFPLPDAADGEWYVALAGRAEATLASGDSDGSAGQAARLERVLGPLAAHPRTLALVADGGAGHAALAAANAVPGVDAVVTLGTPLGPVALTVLDAAPGADALRLLAALLPEPDAAEPDDPDLARGRLLVDGLLGLLRLPDPARELRPPSEGVAAPRAGLVHHALFGVLGEDAVGRAMTAIVAADLSARARARFDAGTPAATALKAGIRLPVEAVDGDLVATGHVLLELVGVDLASGPRLLRERSLTARLELRRAAGWLVGGPDPSLSGARPEHELRRLEAEVRVPLGAGEPASATIVLHEPTTFGVRRPRWVVGPSGLTSAGDIATPALPELRVLLSLVAERLSAASGPAGAVADLLEGLGLLGAGASVPDAIDHLLHDPAAHIGAALVDPVTRAAIETAATALLAGLPGVAVDLDARRIDLALASAPEQGGMVRWTLEASVDAAGAIEATGSIGSTGASAAGGLELALASAPAALALRWHRASAAPLEVPLWPAPDGRALVALAADLLPAELGRIALEHLRRLDEDARPLVEAVYDALGLLGPAGAAGERLVPLPAGLLADPLGWLGHASALGGATGFDAGSVAGLVDALKPILGVGGAPGRWDLAAGVALTVGTSGGDLALGLAVETAALAPPGQAVVAALGVELVPRLSGAPGVAVSLSVGLPEGGADRQAVHAVLDAGSVRVLIRPATGSDLSLFPDPPGLGSLATTAVTQALPLVLDELASRTGTDPAGRAGAVVRALGDALGLRTGDAPPRFDPARLSAFAADPAAALVAALPSLTAAALGTVASSLTPLLPAGSSAAEVGGELRVTVEGVTATWRPAPFRIGVEVAADGIPVAGSLAAAVAVEASGLVALSVEVGPGEVDADVAILRPVLAIGAGAAPPGGRRVELGLGLDESGERSVRARWDLTAGTLGLVVVEGGVATTDAAAVAVGLLDAVLDLAAGVALATDAVQALLDEQIGALSVRDVLRGVLLADVPSPAALDDDLFVPDQLLGRVQRLLANLADAGPSIAIPGGLTVGLDRTGTVVELTLGIAGRADLTSGDLIVSVEADSRWIRGAPAAGVAIGVLDTAGAVPAFAPSLACNGVGIRFSRSTGPLLEAGVSLGSLALHLFGRIAAGQLGAGAQLQLSDLAVAAGGAEGGNPIAQGLLADASASGETLAPSFSPAIAVQKHHDTAVLVSVSAGEGSGPWWLAIQRGFGPLYVEQVGFGVTVTEHQLRDVSLLLDARVSLFGLSAAVDDLELTFVVASDASIFDPSRWSVDLAGLAIGADIGGISLTGGLRKFGEGSSVEYVGMLLGRFAVYGLSVYGGYGTGTAGGEEFASFFAFGAVNGPIGGPPAFFLTGIGGGLGINRGLVFPDDLATFGDFPFIKALDPAAAPSDDPMAELAALRSVFPMERGQFWFAAGISFTSFALVDGVAVVAIEVGDGLEIALLGLARVALPRPQVALVSIELGLVARFSSEEGVLWVQAQLTENSWVLHESVRLTGGFAFVTWFTGPRAGEFVLTMGGFHPSFEREGYPIVPRLGLQWDFGVVVIKGESYFAITSEALMAGGRLTASAEFGPAWARVEFGVDGIVYFDPFRFQASAYARIAAGVTIDVWIGEITIKVSLGARIEVQGPKFRGVATFEVGPVELTVPIGDPEQEPKVFLDWEDFTAKYLEEARPGVARVLTAMPSAGALPPGTGPGGAEAGTADGSAAHPYEVLSEFALTVTTIVPTRTFLLGATSLAHTPSSAIGVAPVNIGSATTTLLLRLLDAAGADRVGGLDHSAPAVGGFPAGVWGPPQPDEDRRVPKGEVITAANGLTLIAEADLVQTLPPEIPYHQVETGPRLPLPLIPERVERPDLVSRAEGLTDLVPEVADDGALLGVAATWLGRGARSATALAAIPGERAGVPLLGALGESLASLEGSTPPLTLRSRTEPTPVDTAVRPPVALGVLTAPVAAEQPRARTTVREPGAAERLRPPTIDEVGAAAILAVPLRLTRARTGAVARETMLARDRVPHTRGAVGAAAAVAVRGADPAGRARLRALDAGLAAGGRPGVRAPGGGPGAGDATLAAGEIAVLGLPNARRDLDERGARPRLAVAGGPARVVALGFGGRVLADGPGDETGHPLPVLTERLVVVALGAAERGALRGWHAGQELAFVGWGTALVPGGTLSVEGGDVRRHRARRSAGWVEAAELVDGAAIVRTRFAQPPRALVVVLEGAAGAGRPAGLDLELTGARQARGADGPRGPVLVSSGNRSLLVYDLQPGPAGGPVEVAVARQAAWTVAGVLAAQAPAARVAAALERSGLDRLAEPLTGPGAEAPVDLRWIGGPG